MVDTTPAFDTTAFTATEQTVDTTQAFDTTAFTQSEPVVDTTPAFDATAFTTTQQTVDTTPAFDTTAFTQNEPVVDTTSAEYQATNYETTTPTVTDTKFDLVNLQNVETTPVVDTGFNITDLPAQS